jgi:hypothetical protein
MGGDGRGEWRASDREEAGLRLREGRRSPNGEFIRGIQR